MERLTTSWPDNEYLLEAVLSDFPYLEDEADSLLQKPDEWELDEEVASILWGPDDWELVDRFVRYPHFAYLTRTPPIFDENSPLGVRAGLPREIYGPLHTYRHYEVFELKAIAEVPTIWDEEENCLRCLDVGPRFQLRPSLNFLIGKSDTTGVIFQCLPWEQHFCTPSYFFPASQYNTDQWPDRLTTYLGAVERAMDVDQILIHAENPHFKDGCFTECMARLDYQPHPGFHNWWCKEGWKHSS